MPTGVKAIETVYNGYRFRSRLEARWAVFLDQIGVPYAYEPEGYEFDGIRYLPDFKLPKGLMACPPVRGADSCVDTPVWLEIKPQSALDDQVIGKATGLAKATETPVYVVGGDPFEHAYTVTMWHQDGERVTWCEPWLWSECPACGAIDLQTDAGNRGTAHENDGVWIMFQCMHCDVHDRSWSETKTLEWHKGFWIVHRRGWRPSTGPRLSRAYLAARGARFEHGESGAPR